MRPSILNTVVGLIVVGTLSLVLRFMLFQYFFAKPIGDMNKMVSKSFAEAQRAMDAASPEDYSTRNEYKNDADWQAAAFQQPRFPRRRLNNADDGDADKDKPKIPVVPPSSWVLFSSPGVGSNPVMHARLALATPDGTPFLTIELRQPKHAAGDEGGAAEIGFATLNQASCGDADALMLRFDNASATRYASKGVWDNRMCRFSLADFGKFRDSLVNATMLNIRVAKAKALTQEIPAPVGGLDWNP